MGRVAQVDGEGFGRLVEGVAGDQHGNRLGGAGAGGKSQRTALGHVIASGGGGAVRGGVVHRDDLRTGGREGHAEFCVGR